jgi:hypothetical protein
VIGDEEYSQSVTIDFEPERIRKASQELLASLKALLPYAQSEAYSLEKLKDNPEAEAEAETAWESRRSGPNRDCGSDRRLGTGIGAGHQLAPMLASLPASSAAASLPHIPVKRRPKNADRFAIFVNGVFFLPVKIDGHGPLLFTELSPPAADFAPRPGRRQTGIRSLADQITLKFRQCPENMKHQLSDGPPVPEAPPNPEVNRGLKLRRAPRRARVGVVGSKRAGPLQDQA